MSDERPTVSLKDWAKHHAPEPPTDCPRCGGQRELDGPGGVVCHFCGFEGK